MDMVEHGKEEKTWQSLCKSMVYYNTLSDANPLLSYNSKLQVAPSHHNNQTAKLCLSPQTYNHAAQHSIPNSDT